MEKHLEALLLYGGYSVWPTESLEIDIMDFPDPPASLKPGGVSTVGEGTFVLCLGGETGSAGDVRLEVSDVLDAADSALGSRSAEFDVKTTVGELSFVSFDLEVIGAVEVGPGQFRVKLEMIHRDVSVGAIETHRITLTSLE